MMNNLILDDNLCFKTDTLDENLRLAGLIYHSQNASHFTSITVDQDKMLWYHDGITTRGRWVLIGHLPSTNKLSLHAHGDYKLAAAIYACSTV
jgi:hypothetical protein